MENRITEINDDLYSWDTKLLNEVKYQDNNGNKYPLVYWKSETTYEQKEPEIYVSTTINKTINSDGKIILSLDNPTKLVADSEGKYLIPASNYFYLNVGSFDNKVPYTPSKYGISSVNSWGYVSNNTTVTKVEFTLSLDKEKYFAVKIEYDYVLEMTGRYISEYKLVQINNNITDNDETKYPNDGWVRFAYYKKNSTPSQRIVFTESDIIGGVNYEKNITSSNNDLEIGTCAVASLSWTSYKKLTSEESWRSKNKSKFKYEVKYNNDSDFKTIGYFYITDIKKISNSSSNNAKYTYTAYDLIYKVDSDASILSAAMDPSVATGTNFVYSLKKLRDPELTGLTRLLLSTNIQYRSGDKIIMTGETTTGLSNETIMLFRPTYFSLKQYGTHLDDLFDSIRLNENKTTSDTETEIGRYGDLDVDKYIKEGVIVLYNEKPIKINKRSDITDINDRLISPTNWDELIGKTVYITSYTTPQLIYFGSVKPTLGYDGSSSSRNFTIYLSKDYTRYYNPGYTTYLEIWRNGDIKEYLYNSGTYTRGVHLIDVKDVYQGSMDMLNKKCKYFDFGDGYYYMNSYGNDLTIYTSSVYPAGELFVSQTNQRQYSVLDVDASWTDTNFKGLKVVDKTNLNISTLINVPQVYKNNVHGQWVLLNKVLNFEYEQLPDWYCKANDVISKTDGANTYRDLYCAIAMFFAGYCHCNNEGKIVVSNYVNKDINLTPDMYKLCSKNDFLTEIIDSIYYTSYDGIIQYIGKYNYPFTFSNNYCGKLEGISLSNIYNELSDSDYSRYRPMKIELYDDYDINVGDIIKVDDENVLIMNKTINNSGVVLYCYGVESRKKLMQG